MSSGGELILDLVSFNALVTQGNPIPSSFFIFPLSIETFPAVDMIAFGLKIKLELYGA